MGHHREMMARLMSAKAPDQISEIDGGTYLVVATPPTIVVANLNPAQAGFPNIPPISPRNLFFPPARWPIKSGTTPHIRGPAGVMNIRDRGSVDSLPVPGINFVRGCWSLADVGREEIPDTLPLPAVQTTSAFRSVNTFHLRISPQTRYLLIPS